MYIPTIMLHTFTYIIDPLCSAGHGGVDSVVWCTRLGIQDAEKIHGFLYVFVCFLIRSGNQAWQGEIPIVIHILNIWAMVNTHYMVDGHPIHNQDPYNGYYKSLWTIGWLAPINGY